MKRFLPFVLALGILVALSLPAGADSGSGPPPFPTCHPAITLPSGQIIPSTGPCTETDHFSDGSFIGTPLACAGPGPFSSGWVSAVFFGNGVQHITVNAKGDFWLTMTFTGTGTFFPILPPDFTANPPTIIPDPTRAAAAGQLTEWFGFEQNANNRVIHDTTHFIGETLAPFPVQTVDMHFQNHVSWTPAKLIVPHTVVHHLSCV